MSTGASCSICGETLGHSLYHANAGNSLTSLCRLHPAATVVRACPRCGHLQTNAISDVSNFYDNDYDILVESEDEDQIYEVVEGKPVFRTTHQVETIKSIMDLDRPLKLLDYGCAKSSTIRALCAAKKSLVPHLYDVSSRYVPYWRMFAPPERWAIKHLPEKWKGYFDVVTSFFSLEHIPRVAESIREISTLLKPHGMFYAIVPNVMANIADFVVVDHCNHFAESSLRYLLSSSGMTIGRIDATSHNGAFVLTAMRNIDCPGNGDSQPIEIEPSSVAATLVELERIGLYWRTCASRIHEFESRLTPNDKVAIYGAGFYGAFIRASMLHPERIVCHLDQNPFLLGKTFEGRPVLPPASLPMDVNSILVGLNPIHARRIIDDIPPLSARNLRYFYL